MSDWGTIVGDRRAWVRDISLTAGLSLLYALLAPFGTNSVPLQQRVLEDFALGFGSFALLWPPMRLALRFGDRNGLPEIFVLIAGLTVLALPVSLLGALIVRLFSAPGPPGNPVSAYFMVLTMVLPGGTAYLMIERRLLDRPAKGPPPERPASTPPPSARPRLLDRLSPRLGHEVLALQGEDHYVRVHTALGSELLLMRLADAVEELDGVAGERVHRSWWVARKAVAGRTASGRRLSLRLVNGLEAPVSRDAAPRLRRGGWLEG